jgi:8-oxo-dGTP diphosphatase
MRATVIYPIRGDEVLLARKSEDSKLGPNCWNGYGGGFEKDEDAIVCSVREMREECEVIIRPEDLKQVAFFKIENRKTDGRFFICELSVFTISTWEGEFQESLEMRTPTWFPISNLPLDEMMLADKQWIHRILNGECLKGAFACGPDQQELMGESIFEACAFE